MATLAMKGRLSRKQCSWASGRLLVRSSNWTADRWLMEQKEKGFCSGDALIAVAAFRRRGPPIYVRRARAPILTLLPQKDVSLWRESWLASFATSAVVHSVVAELNECRRPVLVASVAFLFLGAPACSSGTCPRGCPSPRAKVHRRCGRQLDALQARTRSTPGLGAGAGGGSVPTMPALPRVGQRDLSSRPARDCWCCNAYPDPMLPSCLVVFLGN